MGSRMEKKVTIVIPNYNGKRFLDDCLSSLERQTSKDFETLVIDNASQDDSVSYIREHYPWVKIAVMRHNLGFSGGVNVGILTIGMLWIFFKILAKDEEPAVSGHYTTESITLPVELNDSL